MTIDCVIIEGDYSLDYQIRDLYNDQKKPRSVREIAQLLSIAETRVTARLSSLERYGEVKRRPNGCWTQGSCGADMNQRRKCLRTYSDKNSKCQKCEHRRIVGSEPEAKGGRR